MTKQIFELPFLKYLSFYFYHFMHITFIWMFSITKAKCFSMNLWIIRNVANIMLVFFMSLYIFNIVYITLYSNILKNFFLKDIEFLMWINKFLINYIIIIYFLYLSVYAILVYLRDLRIILRHFFPKERYHGNNQGFIKWSV